MKKYIILNIALMIIFILTKSNVTEVQKENQNKDESSIAIIDNSKEEILVSVSYNDDNFTLNLEDYIIGVLSCEMPALFNKEALKAGAVAIRTFYMYKNLSIEEYIASNTDQCYNSIEDMKNKWGDSFGEYYDRISSAVEETKDEYITYNGEIIESFYFSMSNGYTENVEEVFSTPIPYLVSVESSWDKNINTFEKTINMTKSEFLSDLSLEPTEEINIEILSYTKGNRIDKIKINEKEFRGTEIRKLLKLRSADFKINIEDNVEITTRGYGHGVGMSQYGANEMAKMGYNYKDILKHYYTDTEISKI